jgi:hypothetical protein
MDGTLAVIFIIASLTDMGFNECKTGCIAEKPAPSALAIQAGQVIFQEDDIGREIYATYDMPRRFGPFQPTFGASMTSDNDVWVGAGAKWTTRAINSGPFFVEASLMPGYYAAGDGPDIGGSLQFRSALGAGFIFENGSTLSLLYDHRSNADTQELNPGLETLSLRYSIALN